jgi:NSS family neurotransmitter:Na+ symporter
MITYGSYMRRETNLVKAALTISFLDTIIALMAGLAIFSLVFAFKLEPGAGPGLIFQTLPVLFAQTGQWISVPFFILLTFAALTSSISLLEVVVSYFIDERGWSRKTATISMGTAIYLVGVLCAKWSGIFDIFDYVSTNYMLPIGGLLTCLFAAWVMKDNLRTIEFGSSGSMYRICILLLKIFTPLAIFIVLLHGLELLPFMEYAQ